MGKILDYAPVTRRRWRDVVRKFLHKHWAHLVSAALLGVAIWSFQVLRDQRYMPGSSVRPGTAEQFWNGLFLHKVRIVDHTPDGIIFIKGAFDTYFYGQVNVHDLLAGEATARRELCSELDTSDINGRRLAYLKGMTGQDFGNDRAGWQAWLKDHEALEEDPESVYQRIQLETDKWDRGRGLTPHSAANEAAAKATYQQDIKDYVLAQRKEWLTLFFSLLLVTGVFVVDRLWKRRRRAIVL